MKQASIVDWLLFLTVAVLSVLRLHYFTGGEADLSPESLFKTAAHFVVFALIGASIAGRNWFYAGLAVVFTVVEVVAFFMSR